MEMLADEDSHTNETDHTLLILTYTSHTKCTLPICRQTHEGIGLGNSISKYGLINFYKKILIQYRTSNFFFKKIYLLIMLLQLSHSPPTPLCPAHPLPPTFPTLFLPSPCLFPTYHLCYLFSVPFPPSPFHSPVDNPPCDLHFCDSVPVLVV